jgi:hypothetical protein
MSSKLFPYKLTKGQWFRAESFTESDIAVIVDTSREMIWFWEGTKSSARSRSNARDMLGQLKKKYIVYKFKRITLGSPEDILERLDELREKSFTGKIPGLKLELTDFSKIFYMLNIAASVLIIISVVVLWLMFFGSQIDVGGVLYYSIISIDFTQKIDLISLILLLGFMLYICSSLFGHFLKKKLFSSMTLVALCLIFIAFFMVRIWDILMYYQESGNSILIRKDVFTLFILSLNLLTVPGLVIGLFMGLKGLKNLNKVKVELEEER